MTVAPDVRPKQIRIFIFRYSISVTAIAVAALARFCLVNWFGPLPPFLTLYPAVLAVASVAGGGPGVLATLLAAVLADYFFLPPYHSLRLASTNEVLSLTIFTGTSLLLCLLAEQLRRSRSAQALAEQKDLLAVTLTSIGDGVIVTDANARVTFLNAEAQRLTGWTMPDAEGQPLQSVFKIINEETRHPVESPAQQVLRTGNLVGLANHTLLISKDGREIPIDDSGAPVRQPDGSVIGVVLVFRDFSEKRAAERERQESAARYRAIVETAADGILTIDHRGIVESINPAATRMFGYLAEEVVGKNIRLLMPEPYHSQHDEYLAHYLRTGEARIIGREREVQGRRKDGTTFPLELAVSEILSGLQDTSRLFTGIVRDISDRKRAEETNARLAAIVESSDDAIISKGLDGIIQSWNAGAQKLFGYSSAEIVGKPITTIIPPELHDQEQQIISRLRLGERCDHIDTVRVAKDGRRINVSLTISPVKDRQGRVVGASKIARDITQRTLAEVTLRQSEEQLRALANAMPQLAWMAKPDGYIHWYNNRWYEYTGTTPEQMEGWGWQAVHDPQVLPQVMREWAASIAHWFGTNTDIDQIKRTEDALLESKARMQIATAATEVGIWEWNVVTNQIRWDAQMFRLYGIPPTSDGFVDYSVWSGAVVPEDLPRQEAVLRETVRTLGRSTREFRIRRADNGEQRHLQAVETVLTNSQGNAEWVLGTNLDVTHSKHAERALLAAKATAEAATKAKDHFIAVLSHELRTPLTPVLLTIQMLGNTTERFTPEDRDALTMIRRNVELEVRLIDDLLDLTRISRGKLALQMVPVNLREICRHAQQICDSDLRAKELKLYVAWNAANCTVQADAARLQQILWNLLKNAVKFTPAGGTITIRAENPTPDRIALTVTDTGIGITADQMPQLFKAFEQGDQSHQFGGLGLGLAISRQIAELHGGTLVAHSEGQNKGATFTFELATIAQMEQTTVPSPVRDNPSPPKTSRVLLVEDNPDTSRVMSRLLKLWGFEHHTADSVASALQCAQAESFDVVLSDIGLPDGSGWDLIRALRTRRSYKSIAISGYGMEDDLRRSTEAGFDIHLTKPVDLEHLRQTLHELSAK